MRGQKSKEMGELVEGKLTGQQNNTLSALKSKVEDKNIKSRLGNCSQYVSALMAAKK